MAAGFGGNTARALSRKRSDAPGALAENQEVDSSNRLHFLWTPVWAHPELQEDALSKPDPHIIVPLPDQDFGPSQVAELIKAAYWQGWEDAKREEDHNDRTDVRQLAEPDVTSSWKWKQCT